MYQQHQRNLQVLCLGPKILTDLHISKNLLSGQASPGKKAMQAIKSPCQFGCVGYLALAELLLIFFIFEYLQRQKYIYIANSLNTIHLKKGFCVLLPLNFVLPFLKTRQKKNITFWNIAKFS